MSQSVNEANQKQTPTNPQTSTPTNTQTHKPTNPQTHKPTNTQTHTSTNPQTQSVKELERNPKKTQSVKEREKNPTNPQTQYVKELETNPQTQSVKDEKNPPKTQSRNALPHEYCFTNDRMAPRRNDVKYLRRSYENCPYGTAKTAPSEASEGIVSTGDSFLTEEGIEASQRRKASDDATPLKGSFQRKTSSRLGLFGDHRDGRLRRGKALERSSS